MNSPLQEFIEYIREQDRAITLREFFEHTNIDDTPKTYDKLRDAVFDLADEEYITLDIVLNDKQTLNYTNLIFPTDKLYNTRLEEILGAIDSN